MSSPCLRPAGAMRLALIAIAMTACTSSTSNKGGSAHKALYVVNNDSASISIFEAATTSSSTPIDRISGASTGLLTPAWITTDSIGNIYVTDPIANSITVFAAGAKGNSAPTATIQGSSTLLDAPGGIAVDRSGVIYVSGLNPGMIEAFAPGANGNVPPLFTISGNTTSL